MWVSAIFGAIGCLIMAGAIGLTLVNAWRAARPATWSNRLEHATYVSFAWQELGRGLFLGYLFALGMMPISALFFLGHPHFWGNFGFFTVIIWGTAAILMYFVMVVPGVVGYVLHRRNKGTLAEWSLFAQILIVTAMSLPFAFLLWRFLLPPTDRVVSIILETWRLYARLFT